jgi:hypothetical protein
MSTFLAKEKAPAATLPPGLPMPARNGKNGIALGVSVRSRLRI